MAAHTAFTTAISLTGQTHRPLIYASICRLQTWTPQVTRRHQNDLQSARPRQTPIHTRTSPRASTTPPPESPPPENQSPEGGSEDEDTDESAPPHEIPQTTIDWNKSWSEFQESGARSVVPAGREPVTKRQVAQSKFNSKVRSVSKSLPTRRQLFADWRFWVALIFILSAFTAFVNSGSTTPGVNGI